MAILLKLPQALSVADLLKVCSDLHPMVKTHKVFVASKHMDGEAFVDGALLAHKDLQTKADKAHKEGGEADQALARRTAFHQEARQHVRDARRRVRLIVRFLKRDKKNDESARALLRDYAIRGNQGNINRASHLVQALSRIATAHEKHGPTLLRWGSDEAFVAQSKAMLDAHPEVVNSLTRERSEAELATDQRNQAHTLALNLFNDVLHIVETFAAQDDRAVADFRSVMNKHRTLLQGSSLDADEDDEDDLDANDDIFDDEEGGKGADDDKGGDLDA